jgi:hypothetical protein
MNYSNNDNLLIQSYFTMALLVELQNSKFLESDYYKTTIFEDKFVHENLPRVGIDNQGCLLISLYTLLVVPRQLLENTFPNEFDGLNETIDSLKSQVSSDYSTDQVQIDNVRHLRNAIAHARVDFSSNGFVTFRDENSHGSVCEIQMPLSNVGRLLTELQSIFMKYVEQVKGGSRE